MPSTKPSPSAPQLSIEMQPLDALTANPANARDHSPNQIELLKTSISQFGFVAPVLLGSERTVIAGHGRLAAARALGLAEIPTIDISHLTVDQQRTFAIADNRLAERSTWNIKALALEIRALDALDLDFSLEVTGFTSPELDELQFPSDRKAKDDRFAALPSAAVTREGDVWELGGHKLFCGDATDPAAYVTLMAGETARMAFADGPFNVPVERHIRRRRGEHREFAQAAGELTPEGFQAFLLTFLMLMRQACVPGAIMFCAMDWRSLAELFAAGREAELELKNLIVWAKTNSGLGAFYRSQHEHIAVFKTPGAKNMNTFGMGRSGRHRSNVWTYPGVSSFGISRESELASRPTPKPTAMVADAIKDVSRRGDIVLDPFGGSGSTLIAAEKTQRKARLIEIDATYCDSICVRFFDFTGQEATLAGSGETFTAVRERRLGAVAPNDARAR